VFEAVRDELLAIVKHGLEHALHPRAVEVARDHHDLGRLLSCA
jgi:hypothetical protein